jgi:rhodanese-related sulfurtransferase
MKLKFLNFALVLAAGSLRGYGVSPSRAMPEIAQPGLPPGYQQATSMPPTSANLMPGQVPQPGQTQMISQLVPTQDYAAYKPDQQYSAWEHIHLDEAKRLNADPANVFVDARAKAEYDQGHIPGAVPLPQGEFDKYFQMYKSRIAKAKKIISYCHGAGCKLSEKDADELYNKRGFKNVAVFFGGWPQWQQANLPVEVSTEPKRR